MIGIIVAMDVEKQELIAALSQKREESYHNICFTLGKLSGKEVVICTCGVGKVAAGVITAMLIEKYDPELIINTGVAGGAKEFENPLDLIIASKLTYHDWDNVSVNQQPTDFAHNQYVFETNEKLNQLVYDCFDTSNGNKAYIGPLVSGDCFVGKENSVAIIRNFPEAYGCDMESTSIAHCCSIYGKPVLIIRALSDIVVKDENFMTFTEFVQKASAISANLTKIFLARL